MLEIETGNFAVSRWVLCPPTSLKIVNWNINRGLQLQKVIQFLAGAKPDVVLLQECDLNARRIKQQSDGRDEHDGDNVAGERGQRSPWKTGDNPRFPGQR